MRYLYLCIALVLLICSGVLADEKNSVDFSGEWTLDTAKSEMGESGRRSFLATKMVIKQDGDKLEVESFRRNRDGQEVSIESTYTLDGEECKNESENRSSVSTAEWSADGKTLTITSKTNFSWSGRSFEMDSVEKWSIADGALVIESTVSSQRGERSGKGVYTKS
ncbi:MAG: hypothetical protein FVQ81_17815 [Candidatus Glassbacteria bacterium]|nr:hypothetical protein [Candidatus Glassbacteria bacterium]